MGIKKENIENIHIEGVGIKFETLQRILAKNVPHPVMKSKNYDELLFEENEFLFDKRISKKAIGKFKGIQ